MRRLNIYKVKCTYTHVFIVKQSDRFYYIFILRDHCRSFFMSERKKYTYQNAQV